MKVSVVIPAYNEEGNIPELSRQLLTVLSAYPEFEVIFVDDGSRDQSLAALRTLHEQDARFQYLSFSRNFGHQNALRCGIDHATGDCIISMDADLQHPVSVIPQMIEKWQEGYDIVYTQRIDEKGVGMRKQASSSLFYRVMNWLSDVQLEPGTADFRLLDAAVADVLRNVKEAHLFVRGFVSWMGFRQYKLTYTAAERHSGSTKYSFRKMFSFALHGITSFSIKPLRFSIITGAFISVLAFTYILYAMYISLFTDKAVPGWASTVVTGLFMGGIQLLFMGVLGEYIGKLFIQSKGRPNYIVSESSLHPRRRDRL